MDKIGLGKKGEDRAVGFLRAKGYEIIETNYRKRTGEIDVIAFDSAFGEYVFVEVKTRRNRRFGYPEESVTPNKIRKIHETALQWLSEKNKDDSDWRIDMIGIELINGKISVRHLQNIS